MSSKEEGRKPSSEQPPLPMIKVQPADIKCTKEVWIGHAITIFLYGLYLGVGMLFYQSVESTGKGPWSPLDALYFAHVTMSTVGYGDLSPTSTGSQVFTLFYIVIGVVVIFTRISSLVTGFTQPVFNFCRETLEYLVPQKMIDIDGDGTADFKVPRHPVVFYAKGLALPVLMLLGVQCCFAAMFVAVENNARWTFWAAFYHCLVTATTVGYGDMPIDSDGGKVVAIFQILFSVASIGALIGDVSTLSDERTLALKRSKLLKAKLDPNMITSLDADGNGVDQFEYVIGMLTKLELVSAEDVQPFVTQFKSMDKDGSGLLTKDDLTALADKVASKASEVAAQVDAASSLVPQLPSLKISQETTAPQAKAANLEEMVNPTVAENV